MKSAFEYLKALDRRSPAKASSTSNSTSTTLIQPLLASQRRNLALGLRSGLVTAGLTAATLFGGVAPALAADVVFDFQTLATGTPSFEGDDNPGNDSGAGNDIVRTLDLITYRWQYTVNNGDSNNSIFTVTLSPNHVIDAIPAICQPGTITTAANGAQTLTCNAGTLVSGSTGFLDFQAKVLAQDPNGIPVAHGDQTVATGTFASDDAPFQSDPTAEIANISARPKVDLQKPAARVVGALDGPAGEPGILIQYPLNAIVEGGKGTEILIDPITIIDDLSNHVPGALLYDFGPRAGCGLNGSGVNFNQYPNGEINLGLAERSVSDSGNFSCTQGAPGGDITITLTGADTSGTHLPTRNRNGGTLAASDNYLIAGWMELWVPQQPVLDAGDGGLRVTNTYEPLDTPGVSGANNNESDTDNNSWEHTLIAGRGSFTQYYALRVANRGTVMPGMSVLNGGDGPVMAGQNFAKRLFARNTGITDWDNYVYCEKFDNETHNVTQIPGQPAGSAVQVFNQVVAFPYEIEYGIGGNGLADTCDDTDSTVGWHTSIDDPIFGGSDNINKIRFRATDVMEPNARMDLAVNFTARNTFLTSGAMIPVGELLVNYSGRRTDALNSGNWVNGNYDPTTHGGSKAYGDRLTFTRGIVRIEKTTLPGDSVNSVLAGDTVSFQLAPTVTAPIDPAPTNPDVTITDVLPAGLSYIIGSANLQPTSVTNNADGTTTLIWALGPRVPNQPLPVITFDTQVSTLVANNTSLTNFTVIESPEDATPESVRDDERTITVGNPGAYGLSKDTSTPLIPLDDQMTFRLFMANLSANALGAAQFIDILPFNGDGSLAPNGRSPASSFTGTAIFNSITGSNGETFTFTNAPQASINPDPSMNPSIIWCTLGQFGTGGGCPANNADVTAILIDAPAFPAGAPTRQIDLVLDTDGNDKGQIYTNDVSGLPEGLGFIASPDATVRTLARQVDIELDKSVSDADGIVEVGDTVIYTLDVINKGPNDARLVEIADALPAGLTYVSDDGGGAYDSSTGIWTVGPLAANGTAQLNVTVTISGTGLITNTAEVTKDDDSSDPTATEDVDSTPGNGDGSEDDQDTVTLNSTRPEIGVAKNVASVTGNQVTFDFVVENLGDVDLANVTLTDNLDTTFGAGNYTVANPTISVAPSAGSTVTANTGFNGAADVNLLVPSSSALQIGETVTVQVVVTVNTFVDPDGAGPLGFAEYENQATTTGQSPTGTTVTDVSDDGTDPDPDGDGNPGGPDETDSSEDDPTPVDFMIMPEIGVAKDVTSNVNNDDGTYTVTYAIVVENLGNIDLLNTQLTENLATTFTGATGFTFGSLSVASGPVTANPSFDGATDTNLLVGTDTLPASGTATLELVVDVTPGSNDGPYNNTVVATGETSPGGPSVTDNSDDGTDPDPDGDGNPGGPDETDSSEDDPTPVSFTENPEIGTAKQVTNIQNNADGSYTITYAVAVENLGDVTLSNVQLTEDLNATFGAATSFSYVPSSLAVTGGTATVTANAGFDGTANTDLLAGTDSMAVGTNATLEFQVTVVPADINDTYNNTVVAEGDSPRGTEVTDNSDDGADPDPDGDGNPGGADETDSSEDDSTPVTFSENPEIGTAKNVTSITNNADGSYEIVYAIAVENLGNVNLSNVQLTEDLNATFGAATSFTFDSLSVTSGAVTANPSFNGVGDTNLLVGTDAFGLGDSATLELIVTVVPADVDNDVYNNQVVAGGTSPAGEAVTDDSDDGTDPDPDGDGNPGGPDETDSSEDDPTPVSFTEDPEIGVAKRVTDSVSNRDGTYNVTYRIVVENLGDVNLNNVQLTEDLTTTFAGATAFTVDSLSVVTGGVTANAAFDGSGDQGLLAGTDSLAVGNSAELELVVVITPGVATATYNNTVVADATSAGGNAVTDDSDDGTDPDPDGDGESSGPNNNDPSGSDTEDDPTPVTLTENPEIGTAKQVATAVSNRDGTYTVTYAIAVENLGDVNLNNVQLTENLASTFAGATAFAVDSLTVTSGAVTANPSFDGSVDTDLLTGADTMAVDAAATLDLVVTITPGVPSATYENTVIADGTSPGGTGVTDDSDDGTEVDPDGDGESSGPNNNDPSGSDTEDDPTPVTLTESPEIGTAKQVVSNVNNADGTYTVTYDIAVENLGDVNLNNVQLTENLATTFNLATGFSFSSLTVTSGAVTANPNFDGNGDTNLLVGSDTMAVDAAATLLLVVVVTPGAELGPYDNTVVADGTSPAGTSVTDDSDDGTDPDPDGDGESSGPNTNDPSGTDTEDDPTPVEFLENPVIGTAKQVNNVANNTDGSYTVTYDIAVENFGDVNLSNVQLDEDLTVTFAGASSFTFDSLTVTSGTVTASSTFDGSGNIGLLAGTDTMLVGETATLQLVVTVMPAALDTTYNNQVTATATSPAGDSVNDASDDGTDPDPDGDGTPSGLNNDDPSGDDTEDDPTPVTFSEMAEIGTAKQVNNVVNNGDGTYDVTYDIFVENLGDVELNNVQLTENLATTFASATGFTPGALTVVSGGLTLNPDFNGVNDTGLLAGSDTMAINATAQLQLVVTVTPGAELGPYNNQVIADGTSPGGVGVSDDSDDGAEVDTDGDGVAGGANENDPSGVDTEDDPTPVEFTENPVIGTAKAIASAVSNNDGTFTVTYDVTVQNLGDVNLANVQLTENLASTFTGAQAFAVQSTTVTSGPVTVNPSFNGSSDTNMLAGIDTMAVGDSASLQLVVLVTPGSNLGPYDNSITASAVSPASDGVEDLSDEGENAGDQDGDGGTGGEGENDPTRLIFESNPNISLLKRITAVLSNDGTRTFSDAVIDSDEAQAIQTAGLNPVGVPEITTADPVFSGDILEYTIYFISDGNVPAAPVNLCDLVPTDTTFLTDSFGASQGISILLPGSATPALQTNAVDGDSGAYYSPLSPLPAGTVCADPTNPNGAVLVELQTVPNTPGSNAGFIRFRVRVN